MDMDSMKILVVTNMYPHEEDPSFGAFVAEQVRALRAIGADVDVVFFNGRATRMNYLRGLFEFWGRIHRTKYDIIHAHYMYSGWVARMQRSLPVVVSFHGGGEKVGHEGWLSKRLAPVVDCAIMTSEEHKRDIGYEPAVVLSCGVDLKVFVLMPQREVRAELGWDQDRKVMMYVGASRPEKRLDIIRAAHDIIKSRRDDVDLAIIGGLPHTEVPKYMNAADVLVLVSDYEGAPGVIKEAMACNLPIVSVPVGDVPEVIDGTDGCYLCKQTPEDLADKVELALAFGKRTCGRVKMEAKDSERIAERLMEIYKRIIDQRRVGRRG